MIASSLQAEACRFPNHSWCPLHYWHPILQLQNPNRVNFECLEPQLLDGVLANLTWWRQKNASSIWQCILTLRHVVSWQSMHRRRLTVLDMIPNALDSRLSIAPWHLCKYDNVFRHSIMLSHGNLCIAEYWLFLTCFPTWLTHVYRLRPLFCASTFSWHDLELGCKSRDWDTSLLCFDHSRCVLADCLHWMLSFSPVCAWLDVIVAIPFGMLCLANVVITFDVREITRSWESLGENIYLAWLGRCQLVEVMAQSEVFVCKLLIDEWVFFEQCLKL